MRIAGAEVVHAFNHPAITALIAKRHEAGQEMTDFDIYLEPIVAGQMPPPVASALFDEAAFIKYVYDNNLIHDGASINFTGPSDARQFVISVDGGSNAYIGLVLYRMGIFLDTQLMSTLYGMNEFVWHILCFIPRKVKHLYSDDSADDSDSKSHAD